MTNDHNADLHPTHDETLNHPQPQNPIDSSLDRTHTSQPATLSDTHQAALRHIRTLETHNAKLYQDNCKLVNTVNMLNDRLTFLGAPQNVQAFRFSVMQEKLRTTDENCVLINQKYQDLLHRVSAGSAHHHIYLEQQTVRDAYTSLDREYRVLREKYIRLKAVVDTTQQRTGLVPVVPSDFRAPNQNLNNSASPTSVTSPSSFQPFPYQNGIHRRRGSESVMAQPSLRSGPISVPTTWTAPLPTPPPSATLPKGQMSPTGLPVHTFVPARSLQLPPHAQTTYDAYTSSGLPTMTQSQHPAKYDLPEQLKAAVYTRPQNTHTVNNEPEKCSEQISNLESSPRSMKRPNSDLQTSASQEGEHKKPRTEGENVHLSVIDVDADPANEVLPPPASNDPHNNHNTSESDSDVQSYQDRVNLIFEKDADIENGVFCGLCFNRYQANMISEPPEVLIQPDFDLLVVHCMSMHPSAWDDLRHKA